MDSSLEIPDSELVVWVFGDADERAEECLRECREALTAVCLDVRVEAFGGASTSLKTLDRASSPVFFVLTEIDDAKLGEILELVDRLLVDLGQRELTLVIHAEDVERGAASERALRWLEFACHQRDALHGVVIKSQKAESRFAAWKLLGDREIRERVLSHGHWTTLDCRRIPLDEPRVHAAVKQRLAERLLVDGGRDPDAPEIESVIDVFLDGNDSPAETWRSHWRENVATRTLSESIRWIEVWTSAAAACLRRDRDRAERTAAEWREFAEHVEDREEREAQRRVRRGGAGAVFALVLLLLLGFGVTGQSPWMVSTALLGGVALTLYLLIAARLGSGVEVDRRALSDFEPRASQLNQRVARAELLHSAVDQERARLASLRLSLLPGEETSGQRSKDLERWLRSVDKEVERAAEELTRDWVLGELSADAVRAAFDRGADELSALVRDSEMDAEQFVKRLAAVDLKLSPSESASRWSVLSGWAANFAGPEDFVRDGGDAVTRVSVHGAADLAEDLAA